MTIKPETSQGYTPDQLRPFLEGETTWPYFEERELKHVINTLLCAGASLVNGKFRWSHGLKDSWVKYSLIYTQSGGLTGEAFVLIYQRDCPTAGFVSICNHEKELAPNANPNRGWHPGSCKLCGLNMTVDSGD